MAEKKEKGLEYDKEEIRGRLEKILIEDQVNGREKVALFAARCALRVFPLFGYGGGFDDWNTENGNLIIKHFAAMWRGVLVSWQWEQIQKIKTFNVRFAAAADFDAASAAVFAASSATAVADVYVDASAAAYAATNAAAYAAAASLSASNAATFDLKFLEKKSDNYSDLRIAPLWYSKELFKKSRIAYIYTNEWPSAINSLLEQKEVANNPKLKNQILKVQQDYDAILHGRYPEGDDENIEVKYRPEEKNQHEALADDDFLGRGRLLGALLPRLRVVGDSGHLTVGLFGDWGAGKSNFIKLLKQALDEKSGVRENGRKMEFIYGEFNAWAYEHTDNIQAGMTQEMMNALTSFQCVSKRRLLRGDFSGLPLGKKLKLCCSTFLNLLEFVFKTPWLVLCSAVALHHIRFINYYALFMIGVFFGHDIAKLFPSYDKELGHLGIGVAGAGTLAVIWFLLKEFKAIAAQPFAKELKTYLRLPTYGKHLGLIPVMAKQIKTLCKLCLGKRGLFNKIHRRLIFVVDDLDRCGVEGIVKTFEAVRLILELDNVIVIIAVDQRIALPALACHYEKLSTHHKHDAKNIARDYLAKVINMPLHLPPPDDSSVAQYLAHLFNDSSFAVVPPEEKVSDGDDKENTIETINESDLVDEQQASKQEKDKEGEEEGEQEKEESLEEIFADIAKIDVKAVFSQDKENTKKIENLGLSPEQKQAFYYWLIQLDLRNPRQIKRLYNSYNLLQHYHKEDAGLTGIEHAFPFMVALFLIEWMNQEIIGPKKEQTRQKLIDYLFYNKEESDLSNLRASKEILENARNILKESGERSLFENIEPFVLPVTQNDS